MDSKKPSSPPRQVKKENEEEIKEFAETAMNELLGWYGYERLELRRWAASRAKDAASPDQTSDKKNKDECSWCNKVITSESGALVQSGATYCSELCFSQSRRANFKRAKTCDWCRHVRHTVAYVDFQDGATQLQFCSDKCLNQYKMHIFCRETQAHLELNPHLVSSSSTSNLITPDLWLKNCKSPSQSPNSENSESPYPEPSKKTEKTDSTPSKKSPGPIITVAPTAKLMKKIDDKPQTQKSPETKKDYRTTRMNLRKRRSSKCSSTVTSQTVRQSITPKAQDLRVCSPETMSPSSTIGNSAIHSPPQVNPTLPPQFHNPMFGMPTQFMDAHGFPTRPFMRPVFPMPDRRLPPPPHPPLNPIYPPPLGQTPPVTVLVPYPVILPIPLPIPIPIPLSAFLQAHLSKLKTESKQDEEGPLDFTINGEKKHEKKYKRNEFSSNNSDTEDASEQNDDLERIDVINNSEIGDNVLPKFKIGRLGNKVAKIVSKAKENESSRPLRKRRRLVEATEDELIPKNRKIVEV